MTTIADHVAPIAAAFAQAASLDLAVAPLVVATAPGVGASTMLHGLATASGMGHLEYRLDQLDRSELLGVSDVLSNGEVERRGVLQSGLVSLLTGTKPAIVILDFQWDRPEFLRDLLREIAAVATTETIVALRTTVGDDETTGRNRFVVAMEAIEQGLGIEPEHVPTAVVGSYEG